MRINKKGDQARDQVQGSVSFLNRVGEAGLAVGEGTQAGLTTCRGVRLYLTRVLGSPPVPSSTLPTTSCLFAATCWVTFAPPSFSFHRLLTMDTKRWRESYWRRVPTPTSLTNTIGPPFTLRVLLNLLPHCESPSLTQCKRNTLPCFSHIRMI